MWRAGRDAPVSLMPVHRPRSRALAASRAARCELSRLNVESRCARPGGWVGRVSAPARKGRPAARRAEGKIKKASKAPTISNACSAVAGNAAQPWAVSRWNGLWIVQPAVSFAPDHLEHRMLCAWEFFALCPRCRETGEPRAAASYRSAAGQQTMVRYWCGGCEHSWEVTSNDDDQSADAPEGESLFWYRVTDC
jgi:hypothetical protein